MAAAVGLDFFTGMPRYLENTYLAIRFSLTRRVHFLDEPTVIWMEQGGLSASVEYLLGQPEALRQILRLELPGSFRRGLERKHSAAIQAVAEFHRTTGSLTKAWRHHVEALRGPGGLRHLRARPHYFLAAARRLLGHP